MKIVVKTPTRIDFSGGTLDLYPLYLFMNGGITVNAGVSIYSWVEAETRDDGEIHIKSQDLDSEVSFKSVEDFDLDGCTALIQGTIKSYLPEGGINVTTRNEAPKGSGLGASSSLLIALSAALLKIKQEEIDLTSLIDRAAAIEAAHLGIPTGKQDYYAAALGKIHALHFNEKGCFAEDLKVESNFKDQLERSLIISYTGISHYSGTNNWIMLKKFIDREGDTYENLLKIREVSLKMCEAFQKQDLERIGSLIDREWEYRKSLAVGVSNEFIDNVVASARKAGAWSSKLCGAGGGGCMITITPPDKKEEVMSSLEKAGVQIMNARLDFEGMIIQTINEVIMAT